VLAGVIGRIDVHAQVDARCDAGKWIAAFAAMTS